MARAKGGLSKTFVWIILALLIVGLAGFGATNFSGGVRAVGSVGDAEIDVQDYFRALQNEIRATEAQTGQALPFATAQAMGIPQRVLSQVVVTTALEYEADQLSLSVGDERLAGDLQNIAAFRGPDGSFNRDAYAFALRNAGMNERDFEENLRAESASTILQGAVLAGTRLPDTYVDTLVAFAGEERGFTWAEISQGALTTGLPVPSDADLQSYYDDNIARYTRPETRQITYVWLTPEMIIDTVEVDETALREAYDEQIDEFNLPERRLVERLVFADDATADAALARVTNGEASFEDLVEERGLALADTDLGDMTIGALGAAGEAVFAAQIGDIAGPAPTDLGPALFRVNAVLAAQSTSFEDAQPMLRDTLALDRARRVIEAQAQSFDDDMAGGATLEDLAETTEVRLGQIGWTGRNDEDIAAYDAFRAAAEQVTLEDFPQIDMLGDGGVFAMRLNEVQAPAPIPFDEVRAQVETDWEQQARSDALVAEADRLAGQLGEGTTFEGAGLSPRVEEALTRNANPDDLPAGLLAAAFDMEKGEVRSIPGPGTAYLLRLDAVIEADMDSESAGFLRQIFGDGAAQDIAQDLFTALSSDIQSRAGVNIDQQAINAVHANFTTGPGGPGGL